MKQNDFDLYFSRSFFYSLIVFDAVAEFEFMDNPRKYEGKKEIS